MPAWIPAKRNGQAATEDLEVPVYFPGRKEDLSTTKVYDSVDVRGSFVDSTNAYAKWLGGNLKYPAEADRKQITGVAYLYFVLMPDGSPSNIYVLSDLRIGAGIDEEASRLAAMIPPMKPAMVGGKPVATTVYLPLPFPFSDKREGRNMALEPGNDLFDNSYYNERLREHQRRSYHYHTVNGIGTNSGPNPSYYPLFTEPCT